MSVGHYGLCDFANKMLKLGILEETGDCPKDAVRTVPVHYRFNPDKYKEMKSKGFRLEFWMITDDRNMVT